MSGTTGPVLYSGGLTKKVILAPNVKGLIIPPAEEVIFPPNSTTEIIGPGAAEYVKAIKLPSSLKVIGENALKGSSLTSVVIPSSVVRIGRGAFTGDSEKSAITTLKFENGSHLIAIYGDDDHEHNSGIGAFQYNKLSNVIIPKSVEYIEDRAFESNNLTTVSFETGSKLKYIGSGAFTYNKLTNTGLGKLPSSLTKLYTDAFYSNPDLTQITLTSPKDLPGWPNGGTTADGVKVVYER